MNSPRLRYGLFLRPPAVLARLQAELHTLLERQFGLIAAGAFPPHMTILGHVPTRDDDDDVIQAAEKALSGVGPVRFFNRGLVEYHGGIIHDIESLEDGTPNPALLELFRRARQHLDPLRVPPRQEFKGGVTEEAGFHGHISIAAHDLALRPELWDEVYEFLAQLDVDMRGEYISTTASLYAFETQSGWDGRWWETMSWRLLSSMRLSE